MLLDGRQTPQVPPALQCLQLEQLLQALQDCEPVQRAPKTGVLKIESNRITRRLSFRSSRICETSEVRDRRL